MSILDWNGSISLSAAITQARTDGKELYILPGSYNLGFTAIAPGGTPGTRPIRIYATPRTVTLNFTADDLFFWIENISDVEIGVGSGWGRNDTLSVSANHRRWV